MVRANSAASRSSAWGSWPKNALASVEPAVLLVTSYSSRNCSEGFDHNTLSALTSLNSIFAAMVRT